MDTTRHARTDWLTNELTNVILPDHSGEPDT